MSERDQKMDNQGCEKTKSETEPRENDPHPNDHAVHDGTINKFGSGSTEGKEMDKVSDPKKSGGDDATELKNSAHITMPGIKQPEFFINEVQSKSRMMEDTGERNQTSIAGENLIETEERKGLLEDGLKHQSDSVKISATEKSKDPSLTLTNVPLPTGTDDRIDWSETASRDNFDPVPAKNEEKKIGADFTEKRLNEPKDDGVIKSIADAGHTENANRLNEIPHNAIDTDLKPTSPENNREANTPAHINTPLIGKKISSTKDSAEKQENTSKQALQKMVAEKEIPATSETEAENLEAVRRSSPTTIPTTTEVKDDGHQNSETMHSKEAPQIPKDTRKSDEDAAAISHLPDLTLENDVMTENSSSAKNKSLSADPMATISNGASQQQKESIAETAPDKFEPKETLFKTASTIQHFADGEHEKHKFVEVSSGDVSKKDDVSILPAPLQTEENANKIEEKSTAVTDPHIKVEALTKTDEPSTNVPIASISEPHAIGANATEEMEKGSHSVKFDANAQEEKILNEKNHLHMEETISEKINGERITDTSDKDRTSPGEEAETFQREEQYKENDDVHKEVPTTAVEGSNKTSTNEPTCRTETDQSQESEVAKLAASPTKSPGIPSSAPKTKTKRAHPKASTRTAMKDGDHDSGVDESTQGKESQEESPKKPASLSNIPSSAKSTPKGSTSASSLRTEASPSASVASPAKVPKTPSSTSSKTSATSTPPVTEKKVPMNKVVVGVSPSPNLKVVKSKIGSMENVKHKAGGGSIKVENKKIDLASVKSKIGSTDNIQHKPTGGEKKIVSRKLEWKAQSKIGSLENAAHKAGGGNKKVETVKLDFKEKAKSKVGSKDNITHKAGGGKVQIEEHKLSFKETAKSKIGSLDNVEHKAGGGNVQIFDEKLYYQSQPHNSSMRSSVSDTDDNAETSPSPLPQKTKPTQTKLTPEEVTTAQVNGNSSEEQAVKESTEKAPNAPPATPPVVSATPSAAPAANNAPTATPAASNAPTTAPEASNAPTAAPAASNAPTTAPAAINAPSAVPAAINAPSAAPAASNAPTAAPAASNAPTAAPSASNAPTAAPAASNAPSAATNGPSAAPAASNAPTAANTQVAGMNQGAAAPLVAGAK